MHDRHNVAEHFGNMWLEYSKKTEEGKENRADKGYFVILGLTVLSLAWTLISAFINIFHLCIFKSSGKYGLAL